MEIFFKSVKFFVFLRVQNFMFNILVGQKFSRKCKTFFGIRFRANSLYFPTSFLISYPNILTYIVLCSGTDLKQSALTRISLS